MTWEIVLICTVAFAASWLTLISGFGLGTLLLPVFILFFDPIEAVAMTAVVHFCNNIFKVSLLYAKINKAVLLFFGVSGIFGAWLGAKLSVSTTHRVVYSSPINSESEVHLFSVIVGVLMILFALQELFLGKVGFNFSKRALIPGGAVSGFFGGLTGHQGVLRSMFLLKSGLSAKSYIATGVAIALLVDVTRIPVYLKSLNQAQLSSEWMVLILATGSAFVGALIGKQMIEKVTFRSVQWVVGLLMIGIGFSLLLGVL